MRESAAAAFVELPFGDGPKTVGTMQLYSPACTQAFGDDRVTGRYSPALGSNGMMCGQSIRSPPLTASTVPVVKAASSPSR